MSLQVYEKHLRSKPHRKAWSFEFGVQKKTIYTE